MEGNASGRRGALLFFFLFPIADNSSNSSSRRYLRVNESEGAGMISK